jgi:hypothetical protein
VVRQGDTLGVVLPAGALRVVASFCRPSLWVGYSPGNRPSYGWTASHGRNMGACLEPSAGWRPRPATG